MYWLLSVKWELEQYEARKTEKNSTQKYGSDFLSENYST